MKKEIKDYIEQLTMLNYSENTIQARKSDLLDFICFINKHYRSWTANDFLRYIEHGKYSPRTVRRKLSSLREFIKFLIRNDKLTKNPFEVVPLPREEKVVPNFLRIYEINELKEYLRRMEIRNEKDAVIKVIFGLLLCGLRINELVNIKLDNINLKDGKLKIYGKGKKERIIPIGNFSLECLQQFMPYHRNNDENLLLVKRGWGIKDYIPYRVGEIRKIIAEVTKKVLGREINPHAFRHTVGIILYRETKRLDIVKDYLGHASISTTEKYLHVENWEMDEVIKNSLTLS